MSVDRRSTLWNQAYPCKDTSVALVLVYEKLQLTAKFRLLVLIREDGLHSAIRVSLALQWSKGRHVLND